MQNQQGTIENSSISAKETVIVVRSIDAESVNGEDDEGASKSILERSRVSSVENLKTNLSEAEKHTCVIDIKCDCGKLNKENWDGDKVCRICHLSADCPSETLDLIHLGCGCKDELGIAHRHCAEVWFKLKGNRCCEICGEAAKNITGVGDNRFMEEWNERSDSSGNSDRRVGIFRGQPFCNFLMACLVIAFVLPWFFRVNMF